MLFRIATTDCPFEKLGEIYGAKADDGIKIKLLKYAPIGEKLNYNAQPLDSGC
ncbi:MAG: hypothetical protein QXW59_02000 [Archaeoglobaceae archaeon]